MFAKLSSCLFAVALSVTLVAHAAADVAIINPSSQDAYIVKNLPNRISGGPTVDRMNVWAQTTNIQIRRGLVQFSLATIPLGSTVTNAVLEISAGNNAGDPTLTHGVHRVNADWLETTAKWNNMPPFNASPTATALVGSGTGYKSFNVTTDVQAAVNLCANDHGWLIKDQAETATGEHVNFVSRDDSAGSAQRPKLTVTYTPPGCVTNADCADTNFCTTNEQCVAGVCQVTPVNCNDGNPCTTDFCDCGSGCVNDNICNDGFTCTTDICNPMTQACSYVANDAMCTTQCFVGTCLADPDATNEDPVTGCTGTQSPDTTPCVDGDPCTNADQCTAGTCAGSPIICTPLDQCHDAGTCSGGICSDPPKGIGAPCDDGTLCTNPEACDGAGTCIGGAPTICTPLDQCHDAGICNPLTGICSDPPSSNVTPCDDTNLCTQTDLCDGAGTCVGGNPVICTALDQCHQVGTCDTGTGLCDDPQQPNMTPCDDGNPCTITDQCTSGSCVGNSMTCGDGVVQGTCGEDCDIPGPGPNCDNACHFLCGPVPQAGCRQPAQIGKGTVAFKDLSPDKKDQFNWKYGKGPNNPLVDYGSPLTTTDYWVCVYDGSALPQPLAIFHVPAGGTCGTKPCWKVIKGGYKYDDKLLDPDGIQQLQLREGVALKSKIQVKGKGDNLPAPVLPLTGTVTVQIKNNLGTCWENTFNAPSKNFNEQYRSKSAN